MTISNSAFENNLNNGIGLSSVTNVTVQDSLFQNNENGIFHTYMTNTTIKNNIIQNNRKSGLLTNIETYYIQNKYDSIINNKFYNNILVTIHPYYQMTGNTIDNKVIQYSNKDNTTILPLSNVGLLIAIGTNVTVKNFNLQYGLYFAGTNSTVEDNVINYSTKLPNTYGIYGESRNTIYMNNTILNPEYGLVLCRTNSINNTVVGNYIENATSHYGIYFVWNPSLHDNKIFNNTLINNKLEFVLINGGTDGIPYSLTYNKFGNNTYNGKKIIFLLGQKDVSINNESIGELYLRGDENITIKDSSIDIAIIKDSSKITITNSIIQTSNKDLNSYYSDKAYNGYYTNESVLQYGIILQNTSYVQITNNTFGKNLEDILMSHKTRILYQKITDINITDNRFSQTNTSIMVKPDSMTDKIKISNNTFDKTNYAMIIASKGNYTITQNTFTSNNHSIYQEVPSTFNYYELNITVSRNVFLNNDHLFTTGISIEENDFINNSHYFTLANKYSQQNNFFYPYLTTMVDSNYDNISDNLCTTPDHIYEYARTVPNIVKDTYLPQITFNVMNNSLSNTNDISIINSSSEKITILVSDNFGQWINGTNKLYLGDGLHNLRIEISDTSNNTIQENITIRVDTKSPELNFINLPTNNSFINSTSLLYSYYVQDANGIAQIELYENGILKNTVNNTDISLNAGNYNLTLKATDSTGNSTIIHSYFTVDHTDPIINILMPNITNNKQVRIRYSINEQLSKENVSLDGLQVYSVNDTLYSFNPGHHNITIIAVDRAGNYATLTKSFIIDTTKPEINFGYEIINNNTIKLTFNATDEDGISNFNVYLNNGHQNIEMNIPTIINLQNNANNITIVVMDNANNTRAVSLFLYSTVVVTTTHTTTSSTTLTTIISSPSTTTTMQEKSSTNTHANTSNTGMIKTTTGPELTMILISLVTIRIIKRKDKTSKP